MMFVFLAGFRARTWETRMTQVGVSASTSGESLKLKPVGNPGADASKKALFDSVKLSVPPGRTAMKHLSLPIERCMV